MKKLTTRQYNIIIHDPADKLAGVVESALSKIRKRKKAGKVLTAVAATVTALVLFAGSGCAGDSASASDSTTRAYHSVQSSENGSGNADDSSGQGSAGSGDSVQNAKDASEKEGTYVSPEFRDSVFHKELAETDGTMYIDISAVSEGYVAVAGTSDAKLKFQVVFGESTYNYDLPSDGTPAAYPLQSGNGHYTFRVMENIVDSKYALAFEANADVTLYSEFEPYLRPNIYCNYSENSQCVKKAAEFASRSDNMPEIISQVYEYICSSVTYDFEKAANVQSGYLPEPDETMSTGKGICMDYAALTAAMMRSQGIPTKVIFGYVAPDDLYHAWNMFYTEETGWVSVEFKIDENNWNRLDLTFSANGSSDSFIGNGTNYSDVYQY